MELGMLLDLNDSEFSEDHGPKGESTMSQEVSFKTAVCSDYEQLLYDCQNALEIWRHRRDEAARANLTGKQIGDELQKLQANYAKAYSALNRHDKQCELCQFVSRIAGRPFSTLPSEVADKQHTH
jgi:hypothetical protein